MPQGTPGAVAGRATLLIVMVGWLCLLLWPWLDHHALCGLIILRFCRAEVPPLTERSDRIGTHFFVVRSAPGHPWGRGQPRYASNCDGGVVMSTFVALVRPPCTMWSDHTEIL